MKSMVSGAFLSLSPRALCSKSGVCSVQKETRGGVSLARAGPWHGGVPATSLGCRRVCACHQAPPGKALPEELKEAVTQRRRQVLQPPAERA